MSVYEDMARDAGITDGSECRHYAALIEEEMHRQMEQQHFDEFMEQKLLDSALLNPVINILPGIIEETPDTKGS